jgi:hypothetical protein
MMAEGFDPPLGYIFMPAYRLVASLGSLLSVFSVETAYYLHAVPSFSDSALASPILSQDFDFDMSIMPASLRRENPAI